MNMDKKAVWALMIAVWMPARPSQALDVGAPLYGLDHSASAIELSYQRLDRKIEQDYAFSSDTFFGNQTENHYIAALHFAPGETIAAKLEIGMVDAEDSEDIASLLGAGIQIAAFESDLLDFNIFAAVRYVADIRYYDDGVGNSPGGDEPEVTRDESYYEAGGGFTLSRTISAGDGTRIVPYVGLVASVMRGAAEETARYRGNDPGDYVDNDVKFREDGSISAVCGLLLNLPSNAGVRLEGRFVDQSSFSAGVFFAF